MNSCTIEFAIDITSNGCVDGSHYNLFANVRQLIFASKAERPGFRRFLFLFLLSARSASRGQGVESSVFS
jgi:hypothetical protein